MSQENYEGWVLHRTLDGDVTIGRRFFYPGDLDPKAEQQLCYEIGGSTEECPWGGPLYPHILLEKCEDENLLSPPNR